MGKKTIKNLLRIEKQLNPNKYLTPKQIKKGLINLGYFYRTDYINRNLVQLRKENKIIMEDNNSLRKRYKLNE